MLKGGRLFSLIVLTALTACGGAREIRFGPEAVARASDIVPGCEGVTPKGEFRTTIRATVGAGVLDNEELLRLDAVPLADAESLSVAVDVTMEVDTGDEICVKSSGSEEVDTFGNDDLSDDEDCQELAANDEELSFSLAMRSGACTLSVQVPAKVTLEE